MITEEILFAVKDHLFGEEATNVYAVLDGASVPGLVEKLYALEPEYECLYRGELAPDMEEVAPYVVRLDPDTEFAEWVLEKGWGKHWGIFAASDSDLWNMRRHLRKFLRVSDSNGKALLFRYYDPRVMRLYLPTCSAEELETIFGPVICYMLEDEDPNMLLRFQKVGDALQKRQQPLELEA